MVDLFYDIIWSQIVKALAARIVIFLALSPTGFFGAIAISLITKVLQLVTDSIYKSISMFIDVSVIRLRNSVYEQAWQVSSDKLAIMLIEHGKDSEEFKSAHLNEQKRFYAIFTFKKDPIGIIGSDHGM